MSRKHTLVCDQCEGTVTIAEPDECPVTWATLILTAASDDSRTPSLLNRLKDRGFNHNGVQYLNICSWDCAKMAAEDRTNGLGSVDVQAELQFHVTKLPPLRVGK